MRTETPLVLSPAPGLTVGDWRSTVPGCDLILVDHAVATRVQDALPRGLPSLVVRETAGPAQIKAVARRIEASDPVRVVAIGGGATMDLAKLALVVAERPTVMPWLEQQATRCGFIPLRAPTRRRHLTLVPTTVGTGSESSAGACFDQVMADSTHTETARSLVAGEALRADRAWVDPALLTSLPLTLVREGTLEALSRVLVSAVVSPSVCEPAEWEAQMLTTHLLDVLDELAVTGVDEDLLRITAIASSMTHRGAALAGRGPYPSPLWFVATELSMVAGVRKTTALSALLGPWAEEVTSGGSQWGAPGVLDRLLPSGGLGLGVQLEHWGLPTKLVVRTGTCRRTAERVTARFGGRLPMMERYDYAVLEDLVSRALVEVGTDA